MAVTVVIAYDVSQDRRRTKVATTLQRWGDRIQRSVFLCTVQPEDLVEIRRILTRLVDTDTDSVYIFRQCRTCWTTVETIGQGAFEEPPVCWTAL